MSTILITILDIVLLLLVLFSYTVLWYYIGSKGRRLLFNENRSVKTKIYWGIFWFVAFSFILAALFRNIISINNKFIEALTYVGAVSIAAFCYLLILFIIADITRFVFRSLGYRGVMRSYLSIVYARGGIIFILTFIILCFGFFKATHPVVTNYEVNINKKAGKIKELNAVMVADVHMGIMIREKGIDKMVASINRLKPDIVFFCGDMVDESTPSSLKVYFGSAFKDIKAKYGVYDITGNHEYAEDVKETISYMKKAKVKVLQDEELKVANSFYVIGRKDAASGEEVKPLSKIEKDNDKELPVIELNHRPVALEEAEKNKVDLQLSGHTHNGQFFPGNLITKLVFEDDYGYLKKGNFNLIVTSGYGTWGPPIRIGTKSEITYIKIRFK